MAALRGLLHGVWALVLLLLLAPAAQAATYAADSSAYNATLYPWITTTTGGTSLTLGDDAVSAAISLGFTFSFGSTNYTTVKVHSNGQLQFGTSSTVYGNTALPQTDIDAVLHVLWDDLYQTGFGRTVTYRTTGTAPNRIFTVSWTTINHCCTNFNATVTFQVQLHEGGVIVYRYGAVDGNGGPAANSDGATIGVEVSNTDFAQFSFATASISNGTTIVWSRLPSPTLVYTFDQSSWTGATGEVTDSSGNGYHGTALGLSSTRPGTRFSSMALNGATGTCAYGQFSRANKQYVAAPGGFPNLGPTQGFTITAWIRSTDVSQSGQRIVVDDENNTQGFYLSLGDVGSGRLTLGTRGTPSNNNLTTPTSVVANNTWYFVAAGVHLPGKTRFLRVYNTAGTLIHSSSNTFTESSLGSDAGIVTIGGESNSSTEANSNFGFSGSIDEVRIYPSALPEGHTADLRALTRSCPAYAAARWRMDETAYSGSAGDLADNAGYAEGPYHAQSTGSPLPTATPTTSLGPRTGSTGTCGYASMPGNQGHFVVNGLPVSTAAGARTSVAFWMYWNGVQGMPIGFNAYDLLAYPGHFGFNTGASDLYGIADTGLANTWVHVVAVFGNGGVASNKLFINGVLQTLTQRVASPNNGNAVVTSTMRIGAWGNDTANRFGGRLDEVQVFNGELTPSEVSTLYNETHACPISLDRVQIEHASGSGLTCSPNTVTVRACQNAGCTTPYTGGITGNLTATGGTVNWPSGAAFSIPAGSSTTTVSLHQTSVGNTVLGTSGLSITPASGTTCNFGSPSCTFTAADSGFLFDVPDQLAESSVQVTVQAVRKSDNSLACTPAFANVTRSVNFRCSYTNPTTGTLPVRIGGTALNASGSAAAACDGTGRAVSLSFNGSGIASTSAQYADVGQIALTATYTGSGSDAGLTMTGTDSFRSAPFDFAVSGVSGSTVAAGSSTTATVTARNYLGNATPNFGRETSPESVTLGFVRAAPTGAGAVSGSFSGNVGSFTNGVATASNIAYTEVGKVDIVATLTSAGYLGSSYRPAGSSHGAMVWCADEGGTCMLPAGTVNTVWYAADTYGAAHVQSGVSTAVGCYNAAWSSDPWVGIVKRCWYVTTSGVNSSNTGTLTLRPHRFEVTATAACPAGSFTYAGQPYGVTVTARNAAGGTTVNYDGTAATTPNQARAVTLSDANSLGLGTLSGQSIALTAFTAGVASGTPTYSFTAKQTAPQSLVLRATDPQGTSSAGYTEAAMALRSGRLRLSNAFGKAGSALQVPVTAEYWSGSSWVVNSADACTTVAASAVALSNRRDATGAATATSTSASAITLSAGRGTLSLAAPSPANASLTLDLSLNLGSSAADQSCLAAHPATTGAARPWLRSLFGSCAATADRDPSARASFGVFAPETRKTVHLRELF